MGLARCGAALAGCDAASCGERGAAAGRDVLQVQRAAPSDAFSLCQMFESSLGMLNRELSSDIFQVGWKQEILSI